VLNLPFHQVAEPVTRAFVGGRRGSFGPAELLDAAEQEEGEDVVLALEVVVESRPRDTTRGGDVIEADVVVVSREPGGCRDQLVGEFRRQDTGSHGRSLDTALG
jgi:hypothetical protein